MKTYALRTFVRRILLVRLGIATVLIAAAVAAAAYVSQQALLETLRDDSGRSRENVRWRSWIAGLNDRRESP